jgi:hypothetical protein
MSYVFRHNFVDRRPQAPRKFSGLLVRDDRRPRCVVVLGDGFTQGFLSHYGLSAVVPSRIGAHLMHRSAGESLSDRRVLRWSFLLPLSTLFMGGASRPGCATDS